MPYKDRETQLQAQRNHYLKNKDTYLSRNQTRRTKRREWYLKIMEGKSCPICHEDSIECLSWHHLDPSQKDDGVTHLLNEFRSFEVVKAEMDKCIILCENCHRKVHSGRITL